MTRSPRVVVVGGGAMGTATARDLALRGAEVVLVERGAFAIGTSGRMHGLLHSGARYAVADPSTARDCARENRILRRIAPGCLTETGGLFVEGPEESATDFEETLAACRACSIRTTVLEGAAVRRREPALSPGIERAIAVPDAVVDPLRLCAANAMAAEACGARLETATAVVDLRLDGTTVTGVEVAPAEATGSNPRPNSTDWIDADFVVNATGAWADRLLAAAGVDLPLRWSRGTMVAVDMPGFGTVVNRCRPPGDADIAVPIGSAAVLGTTDEEIDDPADVEADRGAATALVDDLAAVVPGVADARWLRAYAGVRTFLDPGDANVATRELSRGCTLLDHASRDGIDGLLSVVGGKVTTARLVAERIADRVGAAVGLEAACRTDERPLPGTDAPDRLDGFMRAAGLPRSFASTFD